ncbi:MAG TPA: redox-regulated ATPase YchF [Oligoflexia bacterium]|nr:redox-regulated ATPase YchF [Oligoflexia bacterium]HMP49543.1 redox-regulated ATPase YchF [Oligoflexia bacterium]
MGFNCGIVGLPNVGKSTIFNALTAAGAEAANYPFCTIEPNTGIVAVPDERLWKLSQISGSQKVIPTSVEFVDIAGLVKGASEGEGLGNQFLGHIRAVDAVVHVVRCFEDENITHVEGEVDPKRDVELIETELMLSDLASVEKRIERIKKTAKSGNKESLEELSDLEDAKKYLDEGICLYLAKAEELPKFRNLGLITAKPVLFVGNIAESELSRISEGISGKHLLKLQAVAQEKNCPLVPLSGQVEAELSQLEGEDRKDFLEALGLTESGLERLAKAGYQILDLVTFFTSGVKETRAWTIKRGQTAPEAAGVIHTDFEKGFIRAEVISYADFIECKGEQGAREKGKLRIEGKSYIVEDGDVVHFRFNV